MRLTKKMVNKLSNTPGYELTREQLEQDWKLDNKPYYKEKDCWNFHAEDGCWIEISSKDVVTAFVGGFKIPYDIDMSDCDFKSTWEKKDLNRTIGDNISYNRGIEQGKKIAIKAFKEVIDEVYDSNFDPTKNYLKMFEEKIENKTNKKNWAWMD